jgi:hypothetical protein
MYKFAYLYVRLGYILAGIVFGVSVLFCGGALVVLEFQKPRESADRFNFDLDRIQADIRNQSDTVQQTFGIDPALPALKRLKERDWRSWSVSVSASEYLNAERQEALKDCEELRDAVLAKLQEDIGLILGKLASTNTPAQTNSLGVSDVPEPHANISEGDDQVTLYSRSADFAQRISECESAQTTVAKILEETKSPANRSALERAKGEIDRFLDVLRQEETKSLSPSQTAIVPFSGALPAVQMPQKLAPSRKENARLDILGVLSRVRSAVTEGWALEETIDGALTDTLKDFEAHARLNSQGASAVLMNQVAVVGIFLLLLIVSFFIAVGSDLVKAILDSAVWLSHICMNTSLPEPRDAADEKPDAP